MSSRRRRVLWGLLGGGALMALLVALALGWLMSTSSGLAWVIERARVATEGRLQVDAAPGSSVRAFALRDLYWQAEGWALHIDRVDGQLAWTGLLRQALHIPRLDIGAVQVVREAVPDAADTQAFTAVPGWAPPELSLPFALELDAVSIARVIESERVHAEQITLGARWAASGKIRLERLMLRRDAQTWQLHGDWPGRLELAVFADDPASGLRLSGEMLANPNELSMQLQRNGGGRVHGRLDRDAAWSLMAEFDADDAQALDVALAPGTRVRVQASGAAGQGKLDAEASADGWPAYRLATEWSRGDAGWRIEHLTARDDGGGSMTGQGIWPDEAEVPRSLSLEIEGWQLYPPDLNTPRFSGKLDAEGAVGAMDIALDGVLLGAEVAPEVRMALRLGAEGAALRHLQLQSHGASLGLQGEASWGDGTTFTGTLQADRFDPGWLSANLHGEIGGNAALTVRQHDQGWALALADIQLSGRWNRQDFALQGAGHWDSSTPPQGALSLRLGAGSARLQALASGVQVGFDRLQLADLYPPLQGRVDGLIEVDLPLDSERLQADLRIEAAGWADTRARSLRLQGELGDPSHSLTARFEGLELGDRRIDGQASLRGSRADFDLDLQASSTPQRVGLRLHGAITEPKFDLTLQQFELDTGEAGIWTLAEPAALAVGAQHWQLSPLCLQSDLFGDDGLDPVKASHGPLDEPHGDDRGRLCARRDPQAGSPLQISLAPIDIGSLARLLADPEVWIGQGALSAELQLIPGPDDWTLGPSAIALQRGQLQYADVETARPLLQWNAVRLHTEGAGDLQRLLLSADLGADGHIHGDWQLAELSTTGLPHAEGVLDVDIRHLAALQLLMPDLVDSDGRLHGRLQSRVLDGRVDWHGGLELSDLRGSIPAAGISLRDSSVSLRQQEGRWEIDGQLLSGGGPLRIEGHWLADGGGQWRVAGDRVQLSDTRLLKLVASPDLLVRLQDGALHVSGKVLVPEARFDIERLEAGESASADVVVLDPVTQPGRRGPAIQADVEVVLGERAELRGFGFDGGLKGALQVRERPGQPGVGRGNLELRGRYRAYGQDLTLQRGRLLFSGGALDNPGIDIRAAREVDEVTVGIQVSGPARNPRLRVWSEPAMDQAEAISYLVLGQPLRSAGSADGRQLGEAAAAMGGNLLAARLGGRLGFDTFGIADSGALGGAAFTVGKYLSPALYLSYGVGLFEPGQVVTLRYLLSERADVQIESARESRVGVNYRWETD